MRSRIRTVRHARRRRWTPLLRAAWQSFGVRAVIVVAGLVTCTHALSALPQSQEGFRFRSGVELVNVTATVTDRDGRFVPGLLKEDFTIYEDDEPQPISHFSNERVPVSLGIVLDTSGSMAGEKLDAAQRAIDRFLYDLLDPADEVFLYRFSDDPILVRDWTTDRDEISRAMGRIRPRGGTAMLDTVAEAVLLAQSGRHQKKALVVISDGNDTSSRTSTRDLKQLIRETEVLVYAIGIDGQGRRSTTFGRPRFPLPIPFPIPGPRGPSQWPTPRGGSPGGSGRYGRPGDEPVNVSALRQLTDDSGGRTEIVRGTRDLEPATSGVAQELSQQYYLGYPGAAPKDGRWHTIRLEVQGRNHRIRARRGYVATP